MAFRIAAQARVDLRAIYARGFDMFGSAQADSYAAGPTRTFRLLADNPHLARERTETHEPVRAYRFKAHLIVYLIQDDDILIVRVRHRH